MAFAPQGAEAGARKFNIVNTKFVYNGGAAPIPGGWTAIGIDTRNGGYYDPPYPELYLYIRHLTASGAGNMFSTSGASWAGHGNPASYVHFTAYVDTMCSGLTLFYAVVDWQLANAGTNCANYGVSQYTPGFAPIPEISPSGQIITVGPDKDYETVNAAYAAAVHGDDIIIDPGEYDITGIGDTGNQYLYKCVRFWGATEDPDDVILTLGTPEYGVRHMSWELPRHQNIPEAYRAPGIFHVTLNRPSGYTWESFLDVISPLETWSDSTLWIPPQQDLTAGEGPDDTGIEGWVGDVQWSGWSCLDPSNTRPRNVWSESHKP